MTKFTCDLSATERGEMFSDLSATERGEMFSDLYQHLSQNLTRLEEIFGGDQNWTESYILEFFDVFNEEMKQDTAGMAIHLLNTLNRVYPMLQHLIFLNEVGSADYDED